MRLGDYIDDYCSRCKRSTDHAVVSMEGEAVQRVRCRTCERHGTNGWNTSRSISEKNT